MNWISWRCNKSTAAVEKTWFYCYQLLFELHCVSQNCFKSGNYWIWLPASITSTASAAVSYGANSVCLFAIRKIQLKLYFDFHWKTSFSGWRKVGVVSNIVVSMRIWDSTFYFFVSFEFVCWVLCFSPLSHRLHKPQLFKLYCGIQNCHFTHVRTTFSSARLNGPVSFPFVFSFQTDDNDNRNHAW